MIRFIFLWIATNLERVIKFVLTIVVIALSGWGIRFLARRFMEPSWAQTGWLGFGWFLQHSWWLLPSIMIGFILVVLLLLTIISLIPIRYKIDGKLDSINGIVANIYATYLFRFIRLLWNIKDGVTIFMRQIGASTRIINSEDEAVKEKKRKEEEARKKKLEEQKKKEKEPINYAKMLENYKKFMAKDSSKKHKQKQEDEEPPSGLEVLEDAIEKIESILTYPHLKTIMNLVKRASKKVGRALRPQHIEIDKTFGFNDPTTTALHLCKIEMYAARFGISFLLDLEPDYEAIERIEHAKSTKQGQMGLIASVLIAIGLYIRINFNVNGRLRPFSVIWPFIWLITRRPIRYEISRGIIFATDLYFKQEDEFRKDNKK